MLSASGDRFNMEMSSGYNRDSSYTFKDSGDSSSRFFVSEFHLFNNFFIFNDIDFKFSAVLANDIIFDLQQKWWLIMKNN